MFDLEIGKVIKEIKAKKAKNVLLQLPDGLKPKAGEIADEIEKNTNAEIFLWLGTCFGACDIPQNLPKIDLLIQFGHRPFHKTQQW